MEHGSEDIKGRKNLDNEIHCGRKVILSAVRLRMLPKYVNSDDRLKGTCFLLIIAFLFVLCSFTYAEELKLQDLIGEALKNNHEIIMIEAKAGAARFRVPQAKSLPDPMFMIGYQNDGVRNLYTFGNEMAVDSQWMFTASQMFPFPGKLDLKGEMALKDAEGLIALRDAVRLKTAARIRELYFDLFVAYKDIDLLKEKQSLFERIEDASLARYSSGTGMQQEVLMAQTEKYMLLEKEEMRRQKIQSLEAMMNATIGREVNSPLGRPGDPGQTAFSQTMDELISTAYENSPEIAAKKKMAEAAGAKVKMAGKEFYPDFTINATYALKGRQFPDMWSMSAAVNIPLFYKTKQQPAVQEAEQSLSEAVHDIEAVKIMTASLIRDNYSMLRSAERLMDLYKNGLIPKTYQDFESALAGYTTGRIEALTVISRLKNIIEFELLYWTQFTEREKAIARIEAVSGINLQAAGGKDQ